MMVVTMMMMIMMMIMMDGDVLVYQVYFFALFLLSRRLRGPRLSLFRSLYCNTVK